MGPRKLLAAALIVGLSGLAVASMRADSAFDHTVYLTFNRPVALPGVALGTGTYIFQMPDSASHSVVRVLSKDRRMVLFQGLTQSAARRANQKGEAAISFAEARADAPQPISVWWYSGSEGRQFIYAK